MRPARFLVAAVALGLVAGCAGDLDLDSPEARHTHDNAERMLLDVSFLSDAAATGTPPGRIERVECTGGEAASPRGDFECVAATTTGWRVECEGFVTNGRVASGGCAPPRRAAR